MIFEFATANKILFGSGKIEQLAEIAADYGHRALVVAGSALDRAAPVVQQMGTAGIDYALFSISHEPTIADVQMGCDRARRLQAEMVIAVGGGSVIDAGKAIAALLTNKGNIFDYLEVIGKGAPTRHRSAPFIAIPTTAGTGTEVTRNAVLLSPEHAVKVSMRGPFLLPAAAIIDPELTVSMPPAVTAATGLDALTQLLEAYVSRKANPLTDGICREGLQRAAAGLRNAFRDGNDRKAREDMAIASLFGGFALANAGLGAVHGFAGPVGAMFSIPHGILCGRLLPFVMVANVAALQARDPESASLHRYGDIAALLTGKPEARAEDGVEWVRELCNELAVPSLCTFGMAAEDIPESVAKSSVSSSMKGNPIELDVAELSHILQQGL